MQDQDSLFTEYPPHVRAILRACAALAAQVRAGQTDGMVILTFLDGRAVDVFDAGNISPYVAADACRRVANRFGWD